MALYIALHCIAHHIALLSTLHHTSHCTIHCIALHISRYTSHCTIHCITPYTASHCLTHHIASYIAWHCLTHQSDSVLRCLSRVTLLSWPAAWRQRPTLPLLQKDCSPVQVTIACMLQALGECSIVPVALCKDVAGPRTSKFAPVQLPQCNLAPVHK